MGVHEATLYMWQVLHRGQLAVPIAYCFPPLCMLFQYSRHIRSLRKAVPLLLTSLSQHLYSSCSDYQPQ